jgi:hypothetical protein
MNRISALIKRAMDLSCSFLPWENTKKVAVCNSKKDPNKNPPS